MTLIFAPRTSNINMLLCPRRSTFNFDPPPLLYLYFYPITSIATSFQLLNDYNPYPAAVRRQVSWLSAQTLVSCLSSPVVRPSAEVIRQGGNHKLPSLDIFSAFLPGNILIYHPPPSPRPPQNKLLPHVPHSIPGISIRFEESQLL